jgi:SAM-dependent methyltransferase
MTSLPAPYVPRDPAALAPGDRRRAATRAYVASQLRQAYQRLTDQHLREDASQILVDLGCGGMPYRAMMQPRLARYVGVDIAGNPDAQAHFDATGRCELPDQLADLALSSQVLEHVPDPAAYLAEAHRLLKPGGTLLLSTHGEWVYHPDPTDYWRWTCDGLKKIVTDAGFQVQSFEGVVGLPAVCLQMLHDTLRRRVHWRLQDLFGRVAQWAIARADRLCTDDQRRRQACVFMLAACKPEGPTGGCTAPRPMRGVA